MHMKRDHISREQLSALKVIKCGASGLNSRSRAEYKWQEAYRYLNKLGKDADVPDPCKSTSAERNEGLR
jgi:hypothetical protein